MSKPIADRSRLLWPRHAVAACTASCIELGEADFPAGAMPTLSMRTRGVAGTAMWCSAVALLRPCGPLVSRRIRSGRSSKVYSAAPTVCPEPVMEKATLSPDWIRLLRM